MANCQGTFLGGRCPGPATDCPIHSARVVQLCRSCAEDAPSDAIKGQPIDLRCSRCGISHKMVSVRNYFLPALQGA